MSDLVGNPEDRFSRVEAQLTQEIIIKTFMAKVGVTILYALGK